MEVRAKTRLGHDGGGREQRLGQRGRAAARPRRCAWERPRRRESQSAAFRTLHGGAHARCACSQSVRTCVYHGGDEAKLGLVRSGLDERSDTERGRSRSATVQRASRGMRLGPEQGIEIQGGGGTLR